MEHHTIESLKTTFDLRTLFKPPKGCLALKTRKLEKKKNWGSSIPKGSNSRNPYSLCYPLLLSIVSNCSFLFGYHLPLISAFNPFLLKWTSLRDSLPLWFENFRGTQIASTLLGKRQCLTCERLNLTSFVETEIPAQAFIRIKYCFQAHVRDCLRTLFTTTLALHFCVATRYPSTWPLAAKSSRFTLTSPWIMLRFPSKIFFWSKAPHTINSQDALAVCSLLYRKSPCAVRCFNRRQTTVMYRQSLRWDHQSH